MERDELTPIFYGTGPAPAPWATDCPVRFDVWQAYAGTWPQGTERRLDVILAINEEHGTRRVLDRLGTIPACAPVAAGGFVVARLTPEELIRVILPLTNLYGLLRLAQEQSLETLIALVSDRDEIVPLFDPQEREERRQERRRHLTWFLRLLSAVLGDVYSLTRQWTPVKAAEAVQNAVLDPEATQPVQPAPIGPVDRRRRYPIVSVTTNRRSTPAVLRSRRTIKADAAEQVFSVDTSAIGWAVLDTGIDAHHEAFHDWDTTGATPIDRGNRVVRAFDLVDARDSVSEEVLDNGLIDWPRLLPHLEMPTPSPTLVMSSRPPQHLYRAPTHAHGTHIAGIIGGCWPEKGLYGICPTIRLYDFRVLDDEGDGDEFSIVTALQAVRYINEQAGRLAIAGVNVSLSVPHDVATHSCGWTPVCIEADRLVRSGVVVVAAAGNAGFSGVMTTLGSDYRSASISDPGNAELAITVGSTHRSDPHRHGVSYFSSRGPTADGRRKPDLLAPGEDIDGPVPGGMAAMHGTSQAAAHVSGAAAMLLARYRELLGRPERVKAILCDTATDLLRERDFQGLGLVDVLRAMQSL
ncbi:S8 family serine peptidase [Actinomycetospora straminea]|uniref:Peptidase S8/S53 domain-containing protein n=1 Tax=Actinomycetospora straminea TaxID=663607 RepID=A0ABP9EGV2_9PSEU|nr:S8 family serine peptidase [Actinomycetospora straminea]MDD7933742.1 S8 family serine peptidase [Actinomycetospora straminea]